MDKLSRFPQGTGEVTLKSDGGNTLDSVVDELKDIGRELLIHRRADEEFVYGEEAEDSEVDLEDVPPKEVENG